MDRLHITIPILVEGRYDKAHLQNITDAPIIPLDGFGIFNSLEKREMLRKIANNNKIIILTDSDAAGMVIRNHLRSILPNGSMINLYTPEIKGKEKRKKAPSKEGLLGVEGVDCEIIANLLLPYSEGGKAKEKSKEVTKTDFYDDKLSGAQNSSEKRKMLAQKSGLPCNMSANALLEAINLLYTYEEYKEIMNDINDKG